MLVSVSRAARTWMYHTMDDFFASLFLGVCRSKVALYVHCCGNLEVSVGVRDSRKGCTPNCGSLKHYLFFCASCEVYRPTGREYCSCTLQQRRCIYLQSQRLTLPYNMSI